MNQNATHRALHHHFAIDGNEAGLSMLRRLFRCFETQVDAPSAAVVRLEIDGDEGRAGLGVGEPYTGSAGDATSFAVTAVNRDAMLSVPHLDVIHAAVVALGDATILLPAHSGSGKSTMSAALTAHGFTYFSDELAPIDEDLTVEAFPKPIVVGSASMGVLEDLQAADFGEDPRRFWFLDPEQIAGGRARVGERRRITHVVLPEYREGASPEFRKLSPGEVAAALFVNSFNLTDRGRPGLERLARLALTVRGLALVHGNARLAAASLQVEIRR